MSIPPIEVKLSAEDASLLALSHDPQTREAAMLSALRLRAAKEHPTIPSAWMLGDAARCVALGAMYVQMGFASQWTCSACGASPGYVKHTRPGRFHKKGDDNHARPRAMAFYRLSPAPSRSRDWPRGDAVCRPCFENLRPQLGELVDALVAEGRVILSPDAVGLSDALVAAWRLSGAPLMLKRRVERELVPGSSITHGSLRYEAADPMLCPLAPDAGALAEGRWPVLWRWQINRVMVPGGGVLAGHRWVE